MSTVDHPDSWRAANWYDENGAQIGSEDLGDLADKLECIYTVSWQSDWSDDEHYQDFLRVYRTPDGYWALYDYECAGYSEYTYDPVETLSVITTTDFNKFWDLILTDAQREKLIAVRTKVGKMLYV